jgi:hypothetical protein
MEELMHDARMRVLHLCLIVLALIVGILSQISLPSPMPPSAILNLTVFALGCILIGTLGGIWLRSRFRATYRLLALVQTAECKIRKTELTRLRLNWIPFGAEVDVHLVSGEHLAFGFWSEDSAEKLLARLQTYVVAKEDPPAG